MSWDNYKNNFTEAVKKQVFSGMWIPGYLGTWVPGYLGTWIPDAWYLIHARGGAHIHCGLSSQLASFGGSAQWKFEIEASPLQPVGADTRHKNQKLIWSSWGRRWYTWASHHVCGLPAVYGFRIMHHVSGIVDTVSRYPSIQVSTNSDTRCPEIENVR